MTSVDRTHLACQDALRRDRVPLLAFPGRKTLASVARATTCALLLVALVVLAIAVRVVAHTNFTVGF